VKSFKELQEILKLKQIVTKNKTQSLMYFITASESTETLRASTKVTESLPRDKPEVTCTPLSSVVSDKMNSCSQLPVNISASSHPARAQAEAQVTLDIATRRVAELATFRKKKIPNSRRLSKNMM